MGHVGEPCGNSLARRTYRDGHRRITWRRLELERLGAVSLGDEEWDGGAAMRDAFIIWLGSVPFHVSTHTIPADP
jgi:hypothetical protein